MNEYYDGAKLLSLKDINGNTPEIYICTSNRTAGKTTYFNRLLVNGFLKRNKKFVLLYRFNYELDDVTTKFFKDIKTLFFNNLEMRHEKRMKGAYCELFIGENKNSEEKNFGVSCGYAVALNNADIVKKFSHLFSDISCILFDEFQSETNHYCDNEIMKFQSIHTSMARGNGKMVRYLPVYMVSNPVSIINPYYTEMGISHRLTENTKFLRGNGFVLEQGHNELAEKAQKESAFQKAFAHNIYTQYSAEGIYLNDNKAFIDKPDGFSRYIVTVKYQNKEYAIREFSSKGIIYCDDKPDTTFKGKLAVTTDDHNINYVMLKKHDEFLQRLRFFFERGCFRFKNLKCKEVIMTMLSY